MRGLFRNNFYATLLSAKAFAGIAVLLGVFVVAMDNAIVFSGRSGAQARLR